ncbi:MAG: thioredoxin family protein, partial [Sciscionella sp.]
DGITLVQISTTYCAPCRQARAVLGRLAAEAPGISHAELDVTNLPSVVGELRVLSTPTTIAYDPNGVELLRISGVPRAGELRTALQRHPVSG